MSFYDDASLVVIPSAQKTSKLYAVKPTDGSGDLAFTRTGDTATRVNSAGLIEKVRTNLILQSNTFSTTWLNDDSTETSGQAGYDGTTNAWLLAKTAANGRIGQVLTVSGSATFSIYAKAGTDSWVRLASSDAGVNAYFNLGTGAVGSTGASTTAAITSVGNGWYRCSISGNASFTYFNIWIADANNDTSGASGNILIQAAQIETSDIATDYIATTTAAVSVGPVANVPRLDYLGSTCGKLLLEPQRTNLVTYSEQFDNAVWNKSQSGTGVAPVVTANNAISPDGTQNADTVVFNSGAGTTASDISAIYQVFGGTTATYTCSFYAKTPSGTAQIQVRIDGSNYEKFTITNEWQRFTLTRALTGTSNAFDFVIRRGLNEPMNASATIQLWGAQVELGAYATSYIPTLAASATRGADITSKTGISSLIGQTEGTMFWEFTNSLVVGANDYMNLSDGSANNWILIGVDGAAFIAYINSGGVNQVYLTAPLTAGTHKVAMGYKNNDVVLYVDGTQVATDTSASIPATSRFDLSTANMGGAKTQPNLTNQALLFKTRLTNAELAELTTL